MASRTPDKSAWASLSSTTARLFDPLETGKLCHKPLRGRGSGGILDVTGFYQAGGVDRVISIVISCRAG